MSTNELKQSFFVIIGPSGSGKTKVSEAVFPAKAKVISHTTRPKRAGEKEGKDYYYNTRAQFEELIRQQAFAEYDRYQGHYYGVAIADLRKKTTDHYAYDVLTFKGFQAIRTLFGEKVIPIFFDISKENVLARLKTRETEPQVIQARLAAYEADIRIKAQLLQYNNAFIIDANQSFAEVIEQVKAVVREAAGQYLSEVSEEY
ncbi:guanylate kinase [Erwinia sp. CPCC 100877]|nr:guanylate kinase [Erwinia sp. CPCC 100877]